ncbi:MAG: two-component system heavy metal sensor histidine kinase CusS [Psychromonas sp.]|jgi:two-component system heavy metal sensor histidine kinase CusS|uniref:heavy metal sensor histidine kinase n=1 Tax=Psychromonas sp. TaxID=1884585 RepID=UPI0039E6E972
MILQRSLTLRLTWFFTMAAIVTLCLLSWCLKNEIVGYFLREDTFILNNKAHMMKELIAKTHLNKDFSEIAGKMEKLEGIAIKIDNPDDKIVLYISDKIRFPDSILNGNTQRFIDSDLDTLRPRYNYQVGAREPQPEDIENLKDNLLEWQDKDNFYRGKQFRFTLKDASHSSVVVTLALNINHHRDFLANLNEVLLKFIVIGALLSALLQWFVTYRGLLPLKILSEKATLVSGKDIKQRMPVDNLPVEIAGLSTTLNSMLARLEDAFQRLENFSSDIAHELRSPINNLMMQTQVTLSQPRSKKEYLMTLGANAEEFQRLAKMISDMLFLAKTENAIITPSAEPILLDQEIADLFEFYDALAEDRNITLKSQGQAAVKGDKLMLRRAFSNLLSNAIYHSFEGSEITINISNIKGSVIVDVVNCGLTIPEEELPHLFERFYRADKARTCCSLERVGLGLAITQSIAKVHGGSVSVRSKDKETTFTFALNGLS